MSLLMVVVVFSLVLGIGSAINSLLAGWPYPARLLLTIVVEVFFMTYVLMPRLTRWLTAWIYPHPPVIR
jgi:antibiotic biosynthesis monooxygenase (ABM) superfamily enzyme